MKTMVKRKNLSMRGGSNDSCVTGSFTVTAGEKCKVIGWQDGTLQDFGHHLKNEMGGVWVHPIKVADAFWLLIDGTFYKADEYETLPYGTVFRYFLKDDVTITRFQYAPDACKGVSIAYTFENRTGETKKLCLQFITRFDVLPVWFSEECGIVDAEDEAWLDEENHCIIAKDTGHDWFGAITCEQKELQKQMIVTKEHIVPYDTMGKGISAVLEGELILASGEKKTVTYYLAGSAVSKQDLLYQLTTMKERKDELLKEKMYRYRTIESKTKLTTDDPDFDQVFRWIKYDTDWLVVDSDSYGRSLAGGLPEYPWWFSGSAVYSTQGLMAMGEFELTKQTLCLIEHYSRLYNGNGRIVHEITTNGNIPNPGNSQETGQFIMALYNYWRWSGDLETVKKLYDYCEQGIFWLLNEMDSDHDLLPSGYGIIEIKGLNVEMIDTAVYTCKALYSIAEMAEALDKDGAEFKKTADQLKKEINTWLFSEKEGLFVDAVGTPAQISQHIGMLLQGYKKDADMGESYWHPNISENYWKYLMGMQANLRSMPQDEEYPFIINKNWVIAVPMETGLADRDKAITALDNMFSDDFIGEYGTYLAGFINNHIMTISTGVHAVAEGRYGRVDHSLDLLKRMCKTFSMTLPGSINEMSPNYGCFTIDWTAYAMMVPVVECFAGFRPMAQAGKLTLAPCVPKEWNKMSLENVRVGMGTVDFIFERQQDKEIYTITLWGDSEVTFLPPEHSGSIYVDGRKLEGDVHFTRGTATIEVYNS